MYSGIEDDCIYMWIQIYRSLSSCSGDIQAAQAALERQLLVCHLKAMLKKTTMHNYCHKQLRMEALGVISHTMVLPEQFAVPQLAQLGS